jgi:peroxiredoxin
MIRAKGLILVFSLMNFVMCSSSSREEVVSAPADEGTWFVTIRGRVQYPQSGQISISEISEISNSGTAPSDTITLRADNSFVKRVALKEPGYYRLNFYNTQVLNVILYKSDLEINVDGRNMNSFSEIKGSPEIDFIMRVNQMMNELQQSPEGAALFSEFERARNEGDQAKMIALQNQYSALEQKQSEAVAALIRQQPASLGVINFLSGGSLDKDTYFETYVFVADKLKKEWPEYGHAQRFIEMVDKQKKTAVGQVAPEIALPDPNGTTVALSSLRGKYVLVDFWAKWCGPCRQENPNVVRVFNKYKDRGFTVYGVSLDRNKADWLKAIEEDKLTWTHVSDLKFWQSEAAKTYDINAIPFSLLLDPNGVIIAKNLRGAALERKLEEIFSAK